MLSSDGIHRTETLSTIRYPDVVLPWFPGDSFPKQFLQILLGAFISKRRLDVHLIVGKKAGAKFAVGCESQAVASRAEVVAESADKTNFALC